MNAPLLEILDSLETELGTLCLRRRRLLGQPDVSVTDITLDLQPLMSSWHTFSEEALATRAIDWHGGKSLDVLVGGLGLGYTAAAALRHPGVRSVRVVEHLPAVIDWMRRGLVPLSEELNREQGGEPNGEARLRIDQGDVYGELHDEPRQLYDLILIDVDHSPGEALGPQSERFYSLEGLQRARRHLHPGGVLAVWSAEDDAAYLARMSQCFAEAQLERVVWENDLLDQGEEVVDFVFLGRR